jgi:hypothetical protein
MKGVITATAVLLAALTLAPQAQARDPRYGQPGAQDHGRYDNRSHDRPNWNDRGRGGDQRNWNNGRNDWRAHNDWRGHDGGYDRDDHRWGRPDYRPSYGYRYPHHYYYDRPYYGYGYGPRYVYPPVYPSAYSYDCGYYSYYDCYDDDGFSLSFSLPLHF